MSHLHHARPTAEELRIRNLVRDGGCIAVSHPVTPHTAAKALVAANIHGAQQICSLGWVLNTGHHIESWEDLVRILQAAAYERLLEAPEDPDAKAAWLARYCNATLRAQDIIACASDPNHPWWEERLSHPWSGTNFVSEDGAEIVIGLGPSWFRLEPEGDKVIVSVGASRWEENRVKPDGWRNAFKRAELAESVGVQWSRDDREAVRKVLGGDA